MVHEPQLSSTPGQAPQFGVINNVTNGEGVLLLPGQSLTSTSTSPYGSAKGYYFFTQLNELFYQYGVHFVSCTKTQLSLQKLVQFRSDWHSCSFFEDWSALELSTFRLGYCRF